MLQRPNASRSFTVIATTAALIGTLGIANASASGHATRTVPQVKKSATGVNFRADLETGNSKQFTALECANPSKQFQIVTKPVRQGRYAAKFQSAPGDNWSNGSIRCLAANYNTNEREGQEHYYGMSMYFPSKPSYNLLWELHTRKDIYSVDGNTSVVPHAIEATNGGLTYRLLTGPANWGWQSLDRLVTLRTTNSVVENSANEYVDRHHRAHQIYRVEQRCHRGVGTHRQQPLAGYTASFTKRCAHFAVHTGR